MQASFEKRGGVGRQDFSWAWLQRRRQFVQADIQSCQTLQATLESTQIRRKFLDWNGYKIIDINFDEMLNMGGNMLMVKNKKGDNCVIMSEKARKGLR